MSQGANISDMGIRCLVYQKVSNPAIACDETVVNTGVKGDVIRLLEEHLKKPLQWFVCLRHSNDLPLGHQKKFASDQIKKREGLQTFSYKNFDSNDYFELIN